MSNRKKQSVSKSNSQLVSQVCIVCIVCVSYLVLVFSVHSKILLVRPMQHDVVSFGIHTEENSSD